MNLAGVMIWTIEQHDFLGRYSSRPYPLINTINEVLQSGETYMPGTCSGTAPMCDIGINNLENTCAYDGQMKPYPGNCHNYYECTQNGGSYTVDIHTCGEYVWDFVNSECVDPTLPGNGDFC